MPTSLRTHSCEYTGRPTFSVFAVQCPCENQNTWRSSTMKRESLSREKSFGILTCFFASGAAGLIYQVAWAKALGLIFGYSVYAVAVVLAVFMAGLAAGSAYLGSWGARHA